MSSTLGYIWSIFGRRDPSISDEKMEEYRMLSGFKPKDIVRIYSSFRSYTGGSETMSKEVFLSIEALKHNPLRNQIALCFGFDEEVVQLDFVGYLSGLSQFNSPGKRDQKLKTAFKLQDFDCDGQLSREDIMKYVGLVTNNLMSEEEVEAIAKNVLQESSSDPKQEFLSFADFQRVVAPTDFQSKLMLPLYS